MSKFIITSPITYKSLMNKSKSDLAYQILDMLHEVMQEQRFLDAGMNNVTAYKLGKVGLQLMEYPREKIGDEIDRGLVLRRLLEESGFGVMRLTMRAPDGAVRVPVEEMSCPECGAVVGHLVANSPRK